jgi:hypothetical protein
MEVVSTMGWIVAGALFAVIIAMLATYFVVMWKATFRG